MPMPSRQANRNARTRLGWHDKLAEHEISAICEDAPELIEEENAIGSSESEHDLDMEQVTEWNAVVF